MNPSRLMRTCVLACCVAAGISLIAPGSALAKEPPPPQTSPEGMQLQASKDARIVYVMPGATFGQFDRVILEDAYVEFANNWERDYNRGAIGLQGRVRAKDVDRIKTGIATEFKKVFTKELQENGGYQVVEVADPTALILRPAIINLQVTAPDLQTSDMRTAYVRSAGQMTLYLELWDPATNTIMARIMDAQEDDRGTMAPANQLSNKAAADRILRDWAEKLRKHLDAARAKDMGGSS